MKRTETFEIVTLRESGMRGSWEYEIVMKDGRAEVSLYMIRYTGGDDERELSLRAECGADEMITLLNDCRILSWDGFNGPHPKGVRDGIMFRFSATVNGGEKITASGSQNFPRRYRDFTDGLYGILHRES